MLVELSANVVSDRHKAVLVELVKQVIQLMMIDLELVGRDHIFENVCDFRRIKLLIAASRLR